jgi:4-amino-4-deoxy-L-arabinose transferase-like glycosyltransferase
MLIAVLTIGFLIRIFMFRSEVFIGIDGVELARLGRNLVEAGHYSFGENYNWGLFFPPGFPFLTGLANMAVKDLFLAGKLVSLSAALLTIYLFYLIGRELGGYKAGLFAALMIAIFPPILRISIQVSTESLFFCMLASTIYFFMLSVRKKSSLYFLLSGCATGLSYLVRPEGIILLVLPFVAIADVDTIRRRSNLIKPVIAILACAIIAFPYVSFLKDSAGRLTLSGKGSYLALLLTEGVTTSDVSYDKAVYTIDDSTSELRGFNTKRHRSVMKFIVEHPRAFISNYIYNVKIAAGIFGRLIFPIFLPLIIALLDREVFLDRRKWSLLLLSCIYFLIYPSFFILQRHLFISVLLLIMFSSSAVKVADDVFLKLTRLFNLGKDLQLSSLSSRVSYIVVGTVILLSIVVALRRPDIKHGNEIPLEHKVAADFLVAHYSADYEKLNIMHRVPWVSYFTGARFTMLPYAGCSDVISFAKLYSVDFIVVDERTQMSDWEYYDELRNMERCSDEVELIYEGSEPMQIKLFKVRYKES